MNVTILICSHGEDDWADLAWARAYPTAQPQSNDVIVHHDHDGTLADARNAAAAEATGDWLCFLDADDELAPGYVRAMEYADHWTGAAPKPLLAPAVQYVRAGHNVGTPGIPNAGRWPTLNECVIGTLVQRRLFLDVGGFRDLPSLEDYDLWLRCAKAGAKVQHVPEAVYIAHLRTGSRNSDQAIYDQLVAEHADVFP